MYRQPEEVSQFACVTVQSTLVEKVISMLRRTMLVKRAPKRKDDPTLVRHVYDIHCINIDQQIDFKNLIPLFDMVLQEDVRRFGNQHIELVINPVQELLLGLQELEFNPIYHQRFINFVTPMVFNTEVPNFKTCFTSFKQITQLLMGINSGKVATNNEV